MSKRFASVSIDAIEQMKKKKFAKKTSYNLKSAQKLLNNFLNSKNINVLPQKVDDIDEILSEFWLSLRKIDGEKHRASSLLTIRQNLRTILQNENNLDIFGESFQTSNNIFENYLKSLKEEGLGFIKHHPDISKESMEAIISQLDINIPIQLQWLAWIYIMIFYCRRGAENLSKMMITHVEIQFTNENVIIKYTNNEKKKNHTELNEDINSGGILSDIKNNPKSPAKVVLKYYSHLNKEIDNFWQKPKKLIQKNEKIWFEKRKLGVNTLSSMMKEITKFCNIGVVYTNHCLRTTACSLLGELGFTDIEVQAVSQHKSLSSLAIYKKVKEPKKLQMAESLAKVCGIQENNNPMLQETLESKEKYDIIDQNQVEVFDTNTDGTDLADINWSEIESIVAQYDETVTTTISESMKYDKPITTISGESSTSLISNFTPKFENMSNCTINFNINSNK